jgi:hypothetical protein
MAQKEYTLNELIKESAENPAENDFFELEKPAMLEIKKSWQKQVRWLLTSETSILKEKGY